MHGDTPDAGRLGGYLNDAQQVPRHFPLKKGLTPSSPSPCTRGCGLGGRFGPAWTTDANTAGTFARLAGPPAVVYVHRAEPDELLLYAHVGPEGA